MLYSHKVFNCHRQHKPKHLASVKVLLCHFNDVCEEKSMRLYVKTPLKVKISVNSRQLEHKDKTPTLRYKHTCVPTHIYV